MVHQMFYKVEMLTDGLRAALTGTDVQEIWGEQYGKISENRCGDDDARCPRGDEGISDDG